MRLFQVCSREKLLCFTHVSSCRSSFFGHPIGYAALLPPVLFYPEDKGKKVPVFRDLLLDRILSLCAYPYAAAFARFFPFARK